MVVENSHTALPYLKCYFEKGLVGFRLSTLELTERYLRIKRKDRLFDI